MIPSRIGHILVGAVIIENDDKYRLPVVLANEEIDIEEKVDRAFKVVLDVRLSVPEVLFSLAVLVNRIEVWHIAGKVELAPVLCSYLVFLPSLNDGLMIDFYGQRVMEERDWQSYLYKA